MKTVLNFYWKKIHLCNKNSLFLHQELSCSIICESSTFQKSDHYYFELNQPCLLASNRDSVEWGFFLFCFLFFVFCSCCSNWNHSVSMASLTSGEWLSKADYTKCQSPRMLLPSSASPSQLSLDSLREESFGLCLYTQCSFQSSDWTSWKQLVDFKEI